MDGVDRRTLLAGAGVVGVAAMARLAHAGPLAPPTGPVAPTGRTAQEIYDKIARTDVGLAEPRIPIESLTGSATALYLIDQPGSYYLSGNIMGVTGKNGIEIASSDVSIDLCGHRMLGTATGTLKGITVVSDCDHISITNGHVTGWSQSGIHLYRDPPNVARYFLLTRLHVADCLGVGIRVGESAQLYGCVVSGNGDDGFRGEYRSTIADCIFDANGGRGVAALVLGSISRCVVSRSPIGVELTYVGAAENCSVGECGDIGIRTFADAAVRRCNVSGSGTGITAYFGKATIEENNIANCNQGIIAGIGSLIRRNNVSRDSSHPGPGIRTDGPQTGIRIDENHVENYDTGVQVQGSRNVITRNTVRNGSNPYAIEAGNTYGPIVNAVGIGALGASGNQNHPWANFLY